ncbi:CD63 antigen [Apostichopus japonicus]|uniref:Tetraspanin n=1 Tax=Stichopus japonicus TaxID=307972 RepID=A0A2G8KN35_STIJA|nr:CD63 antigen [Apostichopus japonicus]
MTVNSSSRFCVQVVTGILNFLFGVLSIGLIIWPILIGTEVFDIYDYNLFDLTAVIESPLLLIACGIMLGTGVIAMVVSILGCIGACVMNRLLLATISVVVIFIFLANFTGAILVAKYTGTDGPNFTETETATTYLQVNYNSSERFASAFDKFQRQNGCCGFDSKKDFVSQPQNLIWPRSCCENENDSKPVEECITFNTGCRSPLRDHLYQVSLITAASLVSVSTFELSLILSTVLLLRIKRKDENKLEEESEDEESEEEEQEAIGFYQ